jgi:molybdenum ABC transporter molybdate-binding protein
MLLAGCASRDAAVGAGPLVVGAPPALRAVFDDVARAVTARHGGQVSVVAGTVSELIASGVGFDVVASDEPDALLVFGARLGERREWASNPLVLIARAGTPAVPLARVAITPWVQRVAIADGRADATGAASEAWLGRAGVRRQIGAQLDYVAGPAQVLDAVTAGRAQLGIVRASDLARATDARGFVVVDRAPDDTHARYPVGIVSTSPRVAAARDFVDELLHGEGPRSLAVHHLMSPGERTP